MLEKAVHTERPQPTAWLGAFPVPSHHNHGSAKMPALYPIHPIYRSFMHILCPFRLHSSELDRPARTLCAILPPISLKLSVHEKCGVFDLNEMRRASLELLYDWGILFGHFQQTSGLGRKMCFKFLVVVKMPGYFTL